MIPPPESNRHPPRETDEKVSSGFLRYAVGRPLMVIAWGVALWGTAVVLRLLWIGVTRGAGEAAVFLFDPFVLVPALAAVVAWTGVVMAFRTASRST